MIREIRGKILRVEPLGVVVDVSGFGIFAYLPSSEGLTEGVEIVLRTHLAIKQDGVDLYGFKDVEDLRFFGLLLSVSGVGPKTALSILKRAPREALQKAIGRRDISYLTKVVGLGKKSAEKIAVEIAEKIGNDKGDVTDDTEVFEMLVALGYTEREARNVLHKIPDSVSGKDARLKAALSASGK